MCHASRGPGEALPLSFCSTRKAVVDMRRIQRRPASHKRWGVGILASECVRQMRIPLTSFSQGGSIEQDAPRLLLTTQLGKGSRSKRVVNELNRRLYYRTSSPWLSRKQRNDAMLPDYLDCGVLLKAPHPRPYKLFVSCTPLAGWGSLGSPSHINIFKLKNKQTINKQTYRITKKTN